MKTQMQVVEDRSRKNFSQLTIHIFCYFHVRNSGCRVANCVHSKLSIRGLTGLFFPPALPGAPECPPGQFPCVDTIGCVDASARCDGQKQCPTGSDEENCAATEGCLDSDWTCRNRLCIPKDLRCNGLNDCLDNSDEQDCGEKDETLIAAPHDAGHQSARHCSAKYI